MEKIMNSSIKNNNVSLKDYGIIINDFPYDDSEDPQGNLNYQTKKRKRGTIGEKRTSLKTFKQFYKENNFKNVLVITFGRFNPPTIGHEKLFNTLKKIAAENNGNYKIFSSHSVDKEKNPLPYEEKIKFLRKMFPQHARNIIQLDKNVGNHILKILSNEYKLSSSSNKKIDKIIMVVGDDRIDDFSKTLKKYNGVEGAHGYYNFEEIDVISAGERDPDSEDIVSGMSASKLRKAAAENDFQTFLKGVPKNFDGAKELFNSLRKAMGLNELKNICLNVKFPSVSNIRELYINGEIFLEGSKIFHKISNEQFIIKERKSNYVICESVYDKNLHKFWLYEILPHN